MESVNLRMRDELKIHACAQLRGLKAYSWLLQTTRETSPHPLQAKVEITTKCQLKCPVCYRTNMSVSSVVDGWACHALPSMINRDMTVLEYEHVLDELRGVAAISPHGWGEPLLHPRFLEMMRMTHRRGMTIHLVTNGLLLTPDIADPFISECHPTGVTFSVDAGEPDAYERLRLGGKYSTFVKNVKSTITIRDKLSPQTQVIFYCTLGTHNLEQIEPLSELGWKLGVDVINFSDLTLYNLGIADAQHAIRTTNMVNHIRERIAQADCRYAPNTRIVFSGQKTVGSCMLAWMQILIQVNGDMSTCACDPARGNIFQNSFKELWNNSDTRNFRRQILEGSLAETTGCYTCILYNRCGVKW